MADRTTSRGLLKDRFSNMSGDADESFCDPCKMKGNWVAVKCYCQICKQYLCQTCLGVHKNQQTTKGHMIIDRNQMPRRKASNTKESLCVEICKTHRPEIVHFHCLVHDVPGCVKCMTMHHATCKKDRIQNISAGFPATKEFKMIQQKLDKFHSELQNMKQELQVNLKTLDARYTAIYNQITSFRKQINDYLDDMQKQLKDELTKMKEQHKTEMKKLFVENESMKSEVEGIIKQIRNDSNYNANSIFVLTKQAKQRLVTMETNFNKMVHSGQQKQQYNEFHPSTEMTNLVSAKTPFGKLRRKPDVNTTITNRGSINVKTSWTELNCSIKDCTLLNPDKMVVTDNNKIKLLDLSDKTLIASYSTSSEPYGVTTISSDQIAVTLPDEDKIQLLTVTSTFSEICDIQLIYRCFGIAYKDKKFAVSYLHPGRIEILDMQGMVLHTIQPKQGDEGLLINPFFIAFGQEDNSVIVSDWKTNEVSVVTFKGQILQTYTHDALQDPCGIGMTPDGVLFVCSRGSNCIHIVSPDFRKSKVNDDSNVEFPWCITYCEVSHRLYISNRFGENNNIIQVYSLNV